MTYAEFRERLHTLGFSAAGRDPNLLRLDLPDRELFASWSLDEGSHLVWCSPRSAVPSLLRVATLDELDLAVIYLSLDHGEETVR